jgi:hypothetical protein
MEITVQITIKSQAGEPELIQRVAHLQRGCQFSLMMRIEAGVSG